MTKATIMSAVTTALGMSKPLDGLAVACAIDVLRDGEGNSVTFVCDNPDFNGQPNSKLNTDRILGLRRLKIVDETGEWEKAMEVIADAVRVMSSKEHARFYVVDKATGFQERIALDLANA